MKSIGTPTPFYVLAAYPLALLVAAASLGGILSPATYARETANWTGQAIGQDWADLLMAVPWLVIAAVSAHRGRRRGFVLLAGAYLYVAYEFVIYAFAVHFNAFFLVYCATLGLSVFALLAMGSALLREDPTSWYIGEVPVRKGAALLLAVGGIFGALWLADLMPAMIRGTTPPSIVEAGVLTNPVHVIDLSIVLPAHLLCGVWLLGRRPLALAVAPILLGFGVLMALSIAGMMVVMRLRGLEASAVVVAAMTLVSLASAWMLVSFLRKLPR